MTRALVTLFVAGVAILFVGAFWQGDHKPEILLLGASLTAIPSAILGVIGLSAMVGRAFGAASRRQERARATHRRTVKRHGGANRSTILNN